MCQYSMDTLTYTCNRLQTCLVVSHPVEHDLRRPVPPRGHVAGHLIIRLSCQTKVQNLPPEHRHCSYGLILETDLLHDIMK